MRTSRYPNRESYPVECQARLYEKVIHVRQRGNAGGKDYACVYWISTDGPFKPVLDGKILRLERPGLPAQEH